MRFYQFSEALSDSTIEYAVGPIPIQPIAIQKLQGPPLIFIYPQLVYRCNSQPLSFLVKEKKESITTSITDLVSSALNRKAVERGVDESNNEFCKP